MSAPMTEEEAGKLERLEKAATPGPWREDTDPGCTGVIGPDGYMIADCMIVSLRKGAPTQARCDSNARLIAAMRNALPALLSTSTALREMREALESIRYHSENQDMSHLTFRIKARECADAAIEKATKP